jgi:uncharacterized protein
MDRVSTMKIQVQDIPSEGLHLSYEVDPAEWDLKEKGHSLLDPAQVVLDVLRQGEGDVYVSGELSAQVQGECSRCVKPIALPIQSRFDLEYLPSPREFSTAEVSLSSHALDLNFYQGDEIDVDDELMGQCLLAVPMYALCQSECRGLCPQCGVNLNKVNCQCHSEPVDLRWAALNNFKYKENNAKSKT